MFNRMMTGVIGATIPVIISSDQVDWNLITEVFGGVTPTVPVKVQITVNTGIVVSSSSTATPAMDLRGLPSGSTIKLINNGYIIGMGGAGGRGQGSFASSSGIS